MIVTAVLILLLVSKPGQTLREGVLLCAGAMWQLLWRVKMR